MFLIQKIKIQSFGYGLPFLIAILFLVNLKSAEGVTTPLPLTDPCNLRSDCIVGERPVGIPGNCTWYMTCRPGNFWEPEQCNQGSGTVYFDANLRECQNSFLATCTECTTGTPISAEPIRFDACSLDDTCVWETNGQVDGDPEDCSRFYQCLLGHAREPMSCSSPLCFDMIHMRCDHCHKAVCREPCSTTTAMFNLDSTVTTQISSLADTSQKITTVLEETSPGDDTSVHLPVSSVASTSWQATTDPAVTSSRHTTENPKITTDPAESSPGEDTTVHLPVSSSDSTSWQATTDPAVTSSRHTTENSSPSDGVSTMTTAQKRTTITRTVPPTTKRPPSDPGNEAEDSTSVVIAVVVILVVTALLVLIIIVWRVKKQQNKTAPEDESVPSPEEEERCSDTECATTLTSDFHELHYV